MPAAAPRPAPQGGADTVLCAVEDGIAIVTLNRPAVHNALSMAMRARLWEVLRQIDADAAVRVVILQGAGPSFCSGADLRERSTMSAAEVRELRRMTPVFTSFLEQLRQPTIAAIQGNALGGGLELALACDLRIAAEQARLGLREVALGIIPGSGGTQRLPRLVGAARAKELIFTAAAIDAREAERIGLVNRVVPGDELAAAARELAQRIAENAPIAVRQAKRAINLGLQASIEVGLAFEAEAYTACIHTQDRTEALDAFREKRKPQFRGE